MAAALLLVALLATLWLARADTRAMVAFGALHDTRDRQRLFVRGAATNFALFLLMPLAGLALLGRFDALWLFPAEFAGADLVPELSVAERMQIEWTMLGTVAAAGVLGTCINLVARTRLKPLAAVTPLLPRNAAETWCMALIAANAGIAEELFFRLYLPLLVTLVGGGSVLAFAAACVVFGAAHRYQGWAGMVISIALGAALAACYLLTHGLALPIALHLLLVSNALIIRPAIRRRQGIGYEG